jgi:hypothetical protein
MLVEVKMRGSCPPNIKPRMIKNIKEFWNDSILALVVPEGNVFYAQRISDLETKPVYYRLSDFEKFQDIFTRVRDEDFSHYKDMALQNMKTKKEPNPNEENEEKQKEEKPKKHLWQR